MESAHGDVREPAAVEQAVAGVQTVIHSAGHVHLGWSQAEVHEAINVEGTRNFALAAQKSGARMVYVSSVNALGVGGRDFEAAEETARPEVVPCPYVTTKMRAEQVIQEHVGNGLDGVIVNPGFMLGPWDWKPSSGRMLLEITRRFAPFAPSGSFSVCDVRDVSAGTIAAAKVGIAGRRYILGGHNLSYFQTWKEMARMAGKRGPLMPAGPLMQRAAGAFGDLWYRVTGKEPDVNSAGVRMSPASPLHQSAGHCGTGLQDSSFGGNVARRLGMVCAAWVREVISYRPRFKEFHDEPVIGAQSS